MVPLNVVINGFFVHLHNGTVEEVIRDESELDPDALITSRQWCPVRSHHHQILISKIDST